MISVSICMIVKNEEAVLKRCLDSVKDLVEEIVIVDTGSNDRTKEIAADYTDKIYDFKWVDDFSYARNFAFSKCSQEYIYSVDADEVLDELNRKRFLELKKNLMTSIEIVQMWYINTKDFATTENYSKELRPKLYKRLREFNWIDPIHESVNLKPVIYDSEIEILHMPISNHARRDFELFSKTIAREGFLSDKLIKMYARELMLAGEKHDFENAKDFFLMKAFDVKASNEIKTYSHCILAKYYRLMELDGDFFKWALKNVCMEPCSEICIEIGLYYYDKHDYEEAIVWFINAAEETKPVIDARANENIPYKHIASCYEEMAKYDELMSDIYIDQANYYLEKANVDE